MNQFLEMFSKYNRREQTILLAGGVVVLLYILWVAVLAPLQKSEVQQIKSNSAISASLGRVKILAAKVKLSRETEKQSAGRSAGNISQIIDTSLQARGLSMSGFQPGTQGEVRVRLDSVNYSSFMQWLHDVEYKHKMIVRDLSIAASSNSGQVTVNIRLRKN